jgi:hypothetical protein
VPVGGIGLLAKLAAGAVVYCIAAQPTSADPGQFTHIAGLNTYSGTAKCPGQPCSDGALYVEIIRVFGVQGRIRVNISKWWREPR